MGSSRHTRCPSISGGIPSAIPPSRGSELHRDSAVFPDGSSVWRGSRSVSTSSCFRVSASSDTRPMPWASGNTPPRIMAETILFHSDSLCGIPRSPRDTIIIAINKDWKEYCEDLLKEYQIYSQNIHVIYGGETRFDSLLCLADACKTLGKDENDIILINHDCARPFVSERILKDNLKMIQRYDMVTTSVPTIDTVLLSEDGICSKEVPERSTVFLDQGPQTLRVDQFLAIVDMLTPKEKEKYMEAGRLYLDKGYRVGIVKGERENFKITTKFDLSLAELILKQGENL